MTRDEIRELAAFQADETKGACALSFYFQPDPPQDRSHRREAIVAKDVVKQALKSAAAIGKNGSLHADLDRVLEVATNLRGAPLPSSLRSAGVDWGLDRQRAKLCFRGFSSIGRSSRRCCRS